MSSPDGLTKHNAWTIFLRVPRDDWDTVVAGIKTEFRMPGTAAWTRRVKTPTPVVIYTSADSYQSSRLAILEKVWTTPLGMIEVESLEREGFTDLAEFRRYWMRRTKKRFNMLHKVQVFRFRLATPNDYDEMGLLLLRRLYGEHL